MTGRRASAALIGNPVRGAGTTAGLRDAEGDAVVLGDALAVDDGLGCEGVAVGLGDGVGLGIALGEVAAVADGLALEAAGAAVVPIANTASAPTATMPAIASRSGLMARLIDPPTLWISTESSVSLRGRGDARGGAENTRCASNGPMTRAGRWRVRTPAPAIGGALVLPSSA